MKRVFLFVMCLVMALPAEAQTAADLNEGLQVTTAAQAGNFTVSWWGKTGRTYFVQQSFDLMTWQYVPVVMSGEEAVDGLNFSCTDTRQFWRLRYTDESYTGTAEDADFDFDGLTNLEEVATFHSDPFEWDTDQDGLDDYSEVHTYLTDPASADTDGDGMSDGLEIWNGLDPTSATGDDGASGDPDNDGLTNLDELTLSFTDPHDADCDDDTLTDGEEFLIYGTSPWSPDSDGDTLGDADEINLYATDPNDSDSDDDDMRDGWEVGNSLDPNSAAGDDGGGGDPDGDLLTNLSEHNFYTDPHDADSDDDTLTDYAEVMFYFTNPNNADSDFDGLGDAAEVLTYLTNPWSHDTDGDTLGDADEINIHGTNPLLKDGDGDGLDDAVELNIHQTDPNLADSDGDGINDKSEIKQGTDAKNAASRPAFESVEVIGDGDEGVRRTKQITITLPEADKSYMVVIAASSEEYPDFTGDQSEFDDVVDWKITPTGGTVIEGEKHVNDLHADWEESESDGTSYLGLSPVAIVKVETIQGSASGTTSVVIELGATNVSDSALPTTLAACVLEVEIEADAGMAGVIGDTVKSVKAGSTVRHFVTPKANPPAQGPPEPLDQPYVILTATGITAEQITDGHASQIVAWEGGEAVPDEPLKRRVPRNATVPTTVKIKSTQDNTALAEMVVWVVWCDPPTVTVGTASFDPLTQNNTIIGPDGQPIVISTTTVGKKWQCATFWKFKFVIKPSSICDPNVLERPNLEGTKTTDVPGAGKPYIDPSKNDADTATYKWDVSRQVQLTVRNPNLIPKADLQAKVAGAYFDNQPTADDVPLPFPTNKAEGNDDPVVTSEVDEDANPYQQVNNGSDLDHSVGELTSIDRPAFPVFNSWGGPGRHYGMEANFREFCRLEITDGTRSTGTFWFKISDYYEWHHYLAAAYNDGNSKWDDAGSDSDVGHPIP